jgi:hypothetical protein
MTACKCRGRVAVTVVVMSLGGGRRLAESFGELLLVRPISSLCGVRNWKKLEGWSRDECFFFLLLSHTKLL